MNNSRRKCISREGKRERERERETEIEEGGGEKELELLLIILIKKKNVTSMLVPQHYSCSLQRESYKRNSEEILFDAHMEVPRSGSLPRLSPRVGVG